MHEKAVFGGGCFWCTEAVFKMLRGVKSVIPGYSGGDVPEPTYEQVCGGNTGHAESVQIEFDPSEITYEELLDVFFATHDPTTLNRQGNDSGTQYRSAIFYASPEQKKAAEAYVVDLEKASPGGPPVVTEIAPLDVFWPAENYHRDYYELNKDKQYCQIVITPKVEKAKKKFRELMKAKGKE